MSDHFIFGYGSLVNRGTHAYATAHPARLKGWKRVWRHTTLREVAFLNVVPDAASEIDGLILEAPRVDPALDQREYAYARTHVSHQVTHPAPPHIEVNLFAIAHGEQRAPSPDHAILMSYLDTVVAGYLAEFGEIGVADFFATTDGWDAPILNDRDAPRYPRHAGVTDATRALTDDQLRGLGATTRRA